MGPKILSSPVSSSAEKSPPSKLQKTSSQIKVNNQFSSSRSQQSSRSQALLKVPSNNASIRGPSINPSTSCIPTLPSSVGLKGSISGDDVIKKKIRFTINGNFQANRNLFMNYFDMNSLKPASTDTLNVLDGNQNTEEPMKGNLRLVTNSSFFGLNNNFIATPYLANGLSHRFPKQILNVLYRQNLQNYNPYKQALQTLEQLVSVPLELKQRIASLCYYGLAKGFLKIKKYAQITHYSQVNLLIRPYMMDGIAATINEKSEQYTQTIYVPVGPTALSFSVSSYPVILADIYPKASYEKTIRDVNRIIEAEYLRQGMGGIMHVPLIKPT